MITTVHREVLELAPGVHQISDFKLDNYYLVIGETSAALIDCGCGLGDPWDEIRELTDLPVTVLLTHGHLDHCGTAHLFEDVRMSPLDEDVARGMFGDVDLIRWYVETRAEQRNPGRGADITELVPSTMPTFFDYRPLEDRQVFDLGGIRLEAIATPGHTPGSTCFLDPRSRILFGGDTLNTSSIIQNKEGGTQEEITTFASSLRTLLARSSEFDAVAVGHDGTTVDKRVISDFLGLCEGLLDGSLVGDYEEIGIRKGRVVRSGIAEFWYAADA